MGARYACLVLALAGCDQLFGITPPATPALGDGRTVPDAPIPGQRCLYEAFDDPAIPHWLVRDPGPTVPAFTIEAGAAVFTLQPEHSEALYNNIATEDAFDLTNGQVTVELLEASYENTTVATETQFWIGSNNTNRYQFSIGRELVQFRQLRDEAADMTTSADYDGPRFHWLRLRHDASTNQIVWEAASAAAPTEFVSLAKQTPMFPVTRLYVALGAGSYSSTPTPGRARFDNVLVEAPSCDP